AADVDGEGAVQVTDVDHGQGADPGDAGADGARPRDPANAAVAGQGRAALDLDRAPRLTAVDDEGPAGHEGRAGVGVVRREGERPGPLLVQTAGAADRPVELRRGVVAARGQAAVGQTQLSGAGQRADDFAALQFEDGPGGDGHRGGRGEGRAGGV